MFTIHSYGIANFHGLRSRAARYETRIGINTDGSIGTWQSTTPFTQERREHTSVVFNGYVYILGGMYDDGTTNYSYKDVQYAPINADGTIGVWQSTTAYPTAYPNHTAVAYSGYVYVFGALEVFYASINADGSIGGWQSVTSASPVRIWHTAVAQNGHAYVLGGLGPVDRLNDVQYASINTNGSLGTWQITTSFSQARCKHTSVIYNGYVYVIGGGGSDGALNDVQYAKIGGQLEADVVMHTRTSVLTTEF